MKLLRSAMLAAGLLAALSLAAHGYTRNTAGTTADGTLDALTDLNTGATPGAIVTTASTNCSVLKNTAGTLFKLSAFFTPTSTANFIRIFDKATTPAPSTDTPVAIIAIPASSVPLPNVQPSIGDTFTAGIGICVTGTGTATSNTSAVGGAVVNYSYK